MDFFGQQDVARRKTLWLVVYFVVATALVVLAVHTAAAAIAAIVEQNIQEEAPDDYSSYSSDPWDHTNTFGNEHRYGSTPSTSLHYGHTLSAIPEETDWQSIFKNLFLDWKLFMITGGLTLLVILGGSGYKTMELSAGGEAVASMLDGRRIQSNTGDFAERQFLNIVEEMSLASGVPVPPVYVLDNESSINAFAAGFTIHDAVIAVTRGALDYLNRDELQGVVAHEFSHILNGDMKLNLRLIGVIYGLLIIAVIGLYITRVAFYATAGSNRRDARATIAIAAAGISLAVIGGVGYAMGVVIKSAISRQREYLADASAVQFTRNPDGIAGALKKLGGRRNTSKIINPHAYELSHFFFGNAFGHTSGWLLSTHPPLIDRIKRIDPSFDGDFPQVNKIQYRLQTPAPQTARRAPTRGGDPLAPVINAIPVEPVIAATGSATVPLGGAAGSLPTAGIMEGGMRLMYIAALLESIPQPLREASREAFGARAVIFATLIDRDPEIRDKQLEMLRKMGDVACVQEMELLLRSVDRMDDKARLPLVETALPNLKSLSPEQYDKFRQTLVDLIKADGRVDLFEFAVQTLVVRHLDIHFGKKQPASIRHHHSTVRSILPEAVRLFSTLAYVGSLKSDDAPIAFEKGMEKFGTSATLLPKESCSLKKLGETLEKLNDAVPLLKHQVIDACAAIVLADGKVTAKEYELAQVIGSILEVPIP
ncbi:MAG: M48 family metallopeptidase, partial [Planctomycetia bacterium]